MPWGVKDNLPQSDAGREYLPTEHGGGGSCDGCHGDCSAVMSQLLQISQQKINKYLLLTVFVKRVLSL